ncbi:MAG: sodium:proton antiporter [Clostridia bacterium]|nr:sodium:proton antiporter [Clostridia bacterium]
MRINAHSEILEDILFVIYPLIILFGLYVILAGTKAPGGGFQGGAILVAVFMSRYLVFPITMEGLNFLKKLDKVILILVIVSAFVYLITGFNDTTDLFKSIYNTLMGILIGVKVGSGLTVIFYTFIDIEGGDTD